MRMLSIALEHSSVVYSTYKTLEHSIASRAMKFVSVLEKSRLVLKNGTERA